MKPGVAFVLATAAWLSVAAAGVATAASVKVSTVVTGLDHPWAIAFLPEGRSLVTERPGRLRIIDAAGALSTPVAGLPEVFAAQTLRLLDVAVAEDFALSRGIYFCYSRLQRQDGFTFSVMTVATAELEAVDGPAPALHGLRTLFEQTPVIADDYGVLDGCRIVLRDGYLFVALGAGDRMSLLPELLDNTFGKVIRIRTDGSVPPDNPFRDTPHARPEIWTRGHRNPEGLALDADGQLWEQEHGPQGGDKINLISRGADYGWPVVGYGVNYGGAAIHAGNHRDGVTEPTFVWVPSIGPSGMAFYSGKLWPEWKGSLFNGALKARALVRLGAPLRREAESDILLAELGERIRDVREAPDGALYVLTDEANGRVLRLTPGDE